MSDGRGPRDGLSPREDLKYLTALLADYAEDTMDNDDVDQIRAEIIEVHDGLERQLAETREALRLVRDWIRDGKGSESEATEGMDAALAVSPADTTEAG